MKRYICLTLLIAAAIALSGCIHDPVDDDYFHDVDKILGKNKPEPDPVIDSITATFDADAEIYIIEIDFSSTQTLDPDTGTNVGLRYFIYFSFSNPDEFSDESEYYSEIRILGFIDEADFEDSQKLVPIDANNIGRRVYFWITAMDDGRESDHSNVVFVDI